MVQKQCPTCFRASGGQGGVNAGLLMPISFSPPADRDLRARGAGVTAVLGPTNTGKTHLAIERMLAHSSGLIGLPLRLLAREVYNRAVERVGAEAVALITGEEKIKPPNPRFWVATVEAMPRDLDVAFLAIDEIQLAADFERGHVFTDRMLNRRGREETLVLGAATMKPIVERLLPGASIVSRPRLSQLTFSGEKKLTRLPRRSAIVAFSAEEVYAIAELIRRQRGGAAVVLGALSPRTRNAQVELYQSGQVDYLVATDAIGMGLNLDVDHIAFASDRKFDGYQFRKLSPSELAQIAGRAGRATRDGTFGTSGRCPPFETELVQALEIAHIRAGEIGAMAQFRSRLLVGRRLASDARRAADGNRAGARAGGRRYSGARSCRARRQGARADQDGRRRRAAVGRLPASRLPQDCSRQSRRAGGDGLRFSAARRRDRDRLVRRTRSRSRIAPTAISIPCPTASPISAPGPLPPIGRIGLQIPSTGRASRARSKTGSRTLCMNGSPSVSSIAAPAS